MSNHAETLILRLAEPNEHEKLEQLMARASLELPDYRDQLMADPDAIHLEGAALRCHSRRLAAGRRQLDWRNRRPNLGPKRRREGSRNCDLRKKLAQHGTPIL